MNRFSETPAKAYESQLKQKNYADMRKQYCPAKPIKDKDEAIEKAYYNKIHLVFQGENADLKDSIGGCLNLCKLTHAEASALFFAHVFVSEQWPNLHRFPSSAEITKIRNKSRRYKWGQDEMESKFIDLWWS